MDTTLFYIIYTVLSAAILLLIFLNSFYCGENTYIVVSTLGKLKTTKNSGIYLGFPLIRKVYKFRREQKFPIPFKKYCTSDSMSMDFDALFHFTVNNPVQFASRIKTFKKDFFDYADSTIENYIKSKIMYELLQSEKKCELGITYVMNNDIKLREFGIIINRFDIFVRFQEDIDMESHWLDEKRNPYINKLKRK